MANYERIGTSSRLSYKMRSFHGFLESEKNVIKQIKIGLELVFSISKIQKKFPLSTLCVSPTEVMKILETFR